MCRARTPLAALIVGLCAGCPATGDEVSPPSDQFYFPTGMDIAPDADESVLFVASANSDLRHDSGTVQVVDLDRVDDLIGDWLVSGQAPDGRDCEVDLMVPYTLVCDEREVIRGDASVRIGNFAADLRVQSLVVEDGAPSGMRVFVAVRGDPSLTWIDYETETRALSCGGGAGGFPECDDAHRLNRLRDDASLPIIPDEPFGLFVDSVNGYVVATHLSNGAVSLADAPPDGDPPVLSDAIGSSAVDPTTGARGAVGVAGRRPGSANDRVYVTSRVEARVQTLIVRRNGEFPSLIPAEFFFLSRGVMLSSNGRGIAFSGDGNRAYIVNRSPPMLHIMDTSEDELGVPRNDFIGAVELCLEAANLTVADTGRGERVYVTCFRNGQVWVINPDGGELDAIIDVGRGPAALVASTVRKRLYVSNNLEDTVAVVDLTPGATTENRVVLRLGQPRVSGELPQ